MSQRKGVPWNCTLKEVPKTIKEQEDLIRQEHQKAHQGQTNTEDKIRKDYQHWPHLRTQVRDIIQKCDTCQKYQGKKNYQAPLQPIPPPTHIFQRWGVDVIGPLPVTPKRNRYILVFVEHLTKWPEAYPMEIADALTIVGHLHDLTHRYGPPEELISDRGTEFVNNIISSYARIHGIHLKRTTSYHPQTNGMTERMNQTIKKGLAKVNPTNWDLCLPEILWEIRNTPAASTKQKPFEIMFAKKTRTADHENLGKLLEKGDQLRKDAQKQIIKAQERQKKYYDQKQKDQKIKIGDQVLVWRSMIETNFAAKLEPKWEGPYLVHNIRGTSVYIRSMDGRILRTPVHINRLKIYLHKP
jgi:hypothetical protein